MQKLVRDYLDELNKKQRKRRKTGIAVMLLIVLAVGGIAGSLTQYGVALTGNEKCGLEEHQHGEACYTGKLACGLEESEGHIHTDACRYPEELVCGLEESVSQNEESAEEGTTEERTERHVHTEDCYAVPEGWACGLEESAGHIHTEECYTSELTCGLEEHIHTEECYIDKTADVEDAGVWDAQYADVEWTKNWGENLAMAAQIQIGYQESSDNYTVAEDGSHKGYTRYGQFVGDAYRDWNTAFVNFCLYYAGLTEMNIFPDEKDGTRPERFPEGLTDSAKWREEFRKVNEQEEDYLACLTETADGRAETASPAAGDIIFFEKEREDGTKENRMGIVSSYDKERDELWVIEGCSEDNEVKKSQYSIGDEDSGIVALLKVTELEEAYEDNEVNEVPETKDPSDAENAEDNQEESEREEESVTRYDYEGEDFHVVVTLTDPSDLPDNAELIVTPVDLSEEEESKVSEEAQKGRVNIEKLLAYDIKFMADGVEIQPGATVKVTISVPEVAEGQGTSVFHVDGNSEVEDMGSGMDGEGNIEFETSHFSKYVITLNGEETEADEEESYSTRSAAGNGNSVIEYDKTAKVTDWDKRTYDIEITASSKVTNNEKPDIYMVLDASGSMNYDVNYTGSGSKQIEPTMAGSDEESSRFCNIKDQLDPTKVYYYGNKKTVTTLSGSNAYLDNPMVYYDGAWRYFLSLGNEKNGKIRDEKGDIVTNTNGYGNTGWKKIPDADTTVIYEWSSRITSLKEVASEFINSSADICMEDQCRIGIIRFSSYQVRYAKLKDVIANRVELLQYINRLYGNGGTQPSIGLQRTMEDDNSFTNPGKEGTKKYVILFSDGKPEVGNEKDPEYVEKSEKERINTEMKIKKLKNIGVTVFTVGFGLNNEDLSWLNSLADSEDHAFSADNADELNIAFKKIQQDIIQNVEIAKANVKDVIDPRFVVLDDNDEPITPDTEGIEQGIYLEYNGGTVYKDSAGNLYVEWKDQTIPKKEDPEWKKIIHVKAKEEYIGGNNVTTNVSPDSSIDAGTYGDFPLPQPTVNVKAELKVNNKEVTVFKGDTVPTEDRVLQELFGEEDAEKYSNVIDGVYKTMGLENFELQWYRDEACTQTITKEELGLIRPDNSTSYYLKVTYDAGQPTAESNANTTLDGKAYEAGTGGKVTAVNSSSEQEYSGKEYGVYKVNIISGEIRITKRLAETADTDQTFTFLIKKDGEDFQTIEIELPAGQLEYTFGSGENEDLLKDLARGTYVITEVETKGYGIKNVEIIKTDTDCRSEQDGNQKSVTFHIGKTDKDLSITGMDGNVINKDYEYTGQGCLGTVVYTNKEVIADDWEIIKRSASSVDKLIPGAEFRLSRDNGGDIPGSGGGNDPGEMLSLNGSSGNNRTRDISVGGLVNQVFYGKSDNEGKIIWYQDEDFSQLLPKIPTGIYTLAETKAPAGYALSSEKWTVNVMDGKLVDISSASGQEIEREEEDNIVYLYYKNEVIYELPDAGGRGIYWYMSSGMLLMAAAALITYRNKRKEVLRS